MWQSFWNPKVLLLTLNYFGIVGASIGMLLFLPQIVKQLGLTNMQVGWVTMIPYLCGAVAMLVWGWVSDRMAERRWNLKLKNGVDVRLPEADVARALDTLAELDRDKHLISRDITAIDLRLPDRVSVHLSDDAAQAR